MPLGPPLPPTIFNKDEGVGFTQTVLRVALGAFAAQESFHGVSWMYPRADSFPGPFVGLQKLGCVPTSSKSVPPTAMLNGVEARPLTASPKVAVVCALKSSHPAEPGSPAATVTVMPCAAACSQTALYNWLVNVPSEASHAPKLSLIASAILLSTMYKAERSIPNAVSVSSDTTRSIVAFGATMPATWTSRSASPSSPFLPGSGPSKIMFGALAGSPNKFRKSVTSCGLMFESATMAMVVPVPSSVDGML